LSYFITSEIAFVVDIGRDGSSLYTSVGWVVEIITELSKLRLFKE